MGVGSGALLSDVELFGGNTLAAGVMDMEVTGDGGWSSEGTAEIEIDFSNQTEGDEPLTVDLPDTDGSQNPAYLWVGATCPSTGDSEGGELSSALSATLSYVDCSYDCEIASGSTLVDFANALRHGVPLDGRGNPGGHACLQPNDPLNLNLHWELDEDFRGSGSITIELLFVGRQCRHNDGTEIPFSQDTGECERLDRGKDISWVAFCAETDETLSIERSDFSVDGDTLVIENAPTHLETVVLKYSTKIRVFEYDGTTDTFRTNGGGDVYSQNTGDNMDNGNGNNGNGNNGNGSDFLETERSNSTPCPGTCGVKFEVEDNGLVEDSKGCDGND